VDTNKENECLRRMRQFLIEKLETPDESGDVIVRRQELEGIAVAVGVDKQWAWEAFKRLKGLAWYGSYIPESRSEERGYTKARIWRGPP
jgi:hypothetical protein